MGEGENRIKGEKPTTAIQRLFCYKISTRIFWVLVAVVVSEYVTTLPLPCHWIINQFIISSREVSEWFYVKNGSRQSERSHVAGFRLTHRSLSEIKF